MARERRIEAAAAERAAARGAARVAGEEELEAEVEARLAAAAPGETVREARIRTNATVRAFAQRFPTANISGTRVEARNLAAVRRLFPDERTASLYAAAERAGASTDTLNAYLDQFATSEARGAVTSPRLQQQIDTARRFGATEEDIQAMLKTL